MAATKKAAAPVVKKYKAVVGVVSSEDKSVIPAGTAFTEAETTADVASLIADGIAKEVK